MGGKTRSGRGQPSDSDYENGVSNIMKGDFEWEDKEKDWEDYEAWKENH